MLSRSPALSLYYLACFGLLIASVVFYALFPVTCVYLSHMLSIHPSLTGGSRKKVRRPRPRYLRENEEGVLVDEVVIRQRVAEDKRMADQAKKAADRERKNRATKRKLKSQRSDYLSMDLIDCRTIRQGNWYDQPRDEDIEDRGFWCLE